VTNPFEPPGDDPPPAPPPPPYGQSAPPLYGQPLYGQPAMSPPAYGQPAYGAHPMMMRNGLGTAALVLGIIGVVTDLTVFLCFFGFILGILAIVFGAIGRARANRGEASNKKVAIWGLWLGIASLVLSIVAGIVLVHIVNAQNACRERATSQQEYNDCSHKY
jgi:hypothetical protein